MATNVDVRERAVRRRRTIDTDAADHVRMHPLDALDRVEDDLRIAMVDAQVAMRPSPFRSSIRPSPSLSTNTSAASPYM
jgi:hypothetical protein